MAVQDGAFIQCVVEYSLPGTSAIKNVFHYVIDTSIPTSETLVVDGLALHLTLAFNEVEALLSDDMSTPTLTVDEVQWDAINERWYVFRNLGSSILTGIVGGDAQNPMPAAVASGVEFIPIYRRHRGFKYIGGFCEDHNEWNGKQSATLVAALIDFAVAMMTTQEIETGVAYADYVILNRALGTYNVPTSAIVRTDWAYQRRRKAGVGE